MKTIIKTKKDAILVGQLAASFLATKPLVFDLYDGKGEKQKYKVWEMKTFYSFWESLALSQTPKNIRIYVNLKDLISDCLGAQPRDMSLDQDGQVRHAQYTAKEIPAIIRYKTADQIKADLINAYMQIGLSKARATEMTAIKALMQSTAISQIFADADQADLADLADLNTLGF